MSALVPRGKKERKERKEREEMEEREERQNDEENRPEAAPDLAAAVLHKETAKV
jgi:Na+-transporting methylmalonyl-CoA/oxaloacetate decarboxylase gamma subunit